MSILRPLRRRQQHRRRDDQEFRDDRGAVTAELALALPLLLAVTLGLVWLLAVSAAQIRVVDASREAARVVARGDDPGEARSIAQRIAPDGASIQIATSGSQVVVTTRAKISGPGGLWARIGSTEVRAEAVAQLEESS